ncbi:hypothetical protein ANI_1_310014 [Paecilomyces variotii No. 5]|uniref:DUF3669 domain-containing protein n=1 Tax=Byssochlamys spectabilis (strain No. 5 / NBRC 109023) TaxID=1356009 RepID=V5FWG7_BYSSN|nr:hypothetical protein ANI_1_310014 [Paecilomyces variotii No. 5]
MATAQAKRLEGKTIVITGASSGIGKSTAKEFARTAPKDLKLIVTARRVDSLKQLAQEIKDEVGDGVKVLPVKLDVSNPEEVKNFVPSLPDEFKDINVLVNNAGLVKGVARAPDIAAEDLDTMFATNVTGLINMTQAILPIFKKRDEGGRGDIINIGSIAGREPYPGGSIYCATKAAIRSFTDALRKELIATRIRVIEIDPGQVETEFSVVRFYGDKKKADAVYEGCEPLTPDDIAEVIVFAAGRRENVVIADTLIFPSHQASPTAVHKKDELSTKFDFQNNQHVTQLLNLPDDASPETILSRVLSLQPVTSAAFPSVTFHQNYKHISYRVIGFGQCGLVFERPGRVFAVKVAKPAYEEALWTDFIAHYEVRRAFLRYQQQHKPDMECHVPKVFSYIPKSNRQWWELNSPLFTDVHETLPLPAMALITERIPPLPKVARQVLINKYCPPTLRSTVSANHTNRDCLARIYLGRRRPAQAPLPPNFTLRNYNLCLDQMLEINLPIKSLAFAMGEALALIHWSANVDGYDIEFVMGGEADIYNHDMPSSLALTRRELLTMQPHTNIEAVIEANFKRCTTRVWVLDFNLCSLWEESTGWENPDALVAQLVIAFYENDPYYPLPLMERNIDRELWEVFTKAYLETASRTLSAPGKDARLADLPSKFIDACVTRERDALARNLGHGHRELKG